MKAKQTLYEILGVDPYAGLPQLQAAYSARLRALEQDRQAMSPQAFSDRVQVLRVALSTLSDASSRLSYDAKLIAARNPVGVSDAGLALVPMLDDAATASTDVRAEALSLRADALSLRADAMMMRARAESPRARSADVARTVATGTLTGFKYLTRAIGLLVIVAIGAFGLTRCMTGDSSAYRARLEAKAAEKTALQDYFQTHGVRPANMAELELLEAERRRRENSERANDQDRTKAEWEARQFEEDAQRRGREVAENLRLAEERAEREQQRAAYEQQAKERVEQARRDAAQQAEERRVERERQQWREVLRR